MIYNSEYIYHQIKNSFEVRDEQEFLKLVREKKITDDVLQTLFSELRLTLGQNFRLDHICFLLGNGCSIYAGSKSTTEFDITKVIDKKERKDISEVIDKIKYKTMEEQLNALITVQEYYSIIEYDKAVIISRIIRSIKSYLLTKYVNSVKYNELSLHEVMLMKLRSFGCLNKLHFYSPNYDLALEFTLDKLGIEYVNGFSGFVNRKFDPKSLQKVDTTRLVKIHGSVNWILDKETKEIKEIQPKFTPDGKVFVPMHDEDHVIIYPTSQKVYQTYNVPYSELMRSMLNCFEAHRNVILILGYRYADEHINEIIFKAIANPNNIFYFFDYDGGTCDFIQRMIKVSKNTQNINILVGNFLGDFETFVKYILPANAEKTDEEQIFELLNKVMDKHNEQHFE